MEVHELVLMHNVQPADHILLPVPLTYNRPKYDINLAAYEFNSADTRSSFASLICPVWLQDHSSGHCLKLVVQQSFTIPKSVLYKYYLHSAPTLSKGTIITTNLAAR